MTRYIRNVKFQLIDMVKKFDEMEQEMAETGLITRSEACEWVKTLITQFCFDEWSEATCVYLDRHMLENIRCLECEVEMSKEEIDFRYCESCNSESGLSYRPTLRDI